MAYVVLNDYFKQIQEDNLNQVISDDNSILALAEDAAREEIQEYISHRYNIAECFLDYSSFAIATGYTISDSFTSVALWDDVTEYVTGDIVSYLGQIYKCIVNNDDTKPYQDRENWIYIGSNNRVYLEKTAWSSLTTYALNDMVSSGGYVYISLDSGNINNLVSDGAEWAQVGVNEAFYYVIQDSTGNYLNNAAYFTQVDNRSKKLVMHFIDIVLYHVHSRINPRNIPDLRMIRYDGMTEHRKGGAIGWLKDCNCGKITASLPLLAPEQGVNIIYGSNEKNKNTY